MSHSYHLPPPPPPVRMPRCEKPRDDGAKQVGTVDLAPKWVAIVDLLVAGIEDGTNVSRDIAVQEIRRMAAVADKLPEMEKEIFRLNAELKRRAPPF